MSDQTTLNQTPSANRVHIGIYGNRNAGKSSLLNAIVGQEVSIVSDVKGTTTDPVNKVMELIPFGPVVFIDTAGYDDEGELGGLRVEKTLKVLQRTDFALYVQDASEALSGEYAEDLIAHFKHFSIPHLHVINKTDLLDKDGLKALKSKYPKSHFLTAKDAHLTGGEHAKSILHFKDALIAALRHLEEDPPILGDLLPIGSTVVMVVPVDSEAPKGRLILPQVQLIRDCLDHGLKVHVVRDLELADTLKELSKVDLVVTDSQAFKFVSETVPAGIPLTSFSILFARHKGDLSHFVEGAEILPTLKEGANILISESCTHNHSHEDIGRVKIPNLLTKKLGKAFNFTFRMGHDFPTNLSDYDLIIHCGSCMLNKKTMLSRIALADAAGVPITNYGIVLAYVTDILDRSIAFDGLM